MPAGSAAFRLSRAATQYICTLIRTCFYYAKIQGVQACIEPYPGICNVRCPGHQEDISLHYIACPFQFGAQRLLGSPHFVHSIIDDLDNMKFVKGYCSVLKFFSYALDKGLGHVYREIGYL